MKSSKLSKHLTLAAAVAVLAFPPVSSARSGKSSAELPIGKDFITTAADINLGEVELGKLAEQNGNNQAIKDFGKLMVKDHSMAESQLEQIAKQNAVVLPARPATNVSDLKGQLSKESGTKFDQAYLQHMLSGHKQAITTFENEIEHGQDAAFKAYAESVLPTIQDHIRIAEDLAGKVGLSGKLGLEVPSKAISAQAQPW